MQSSTAGHSRDHERQKRDRRHQKQKNRALLVMSPARFRCATVIHYENWPINQLYYQKEINPPAL